jgi:hypothetical protein
MPHPYRDLIRELHLPKDRCFKCDPTYDELVDLCRRAHDALIAMGSKHDQDQIEHDECRELFHGRRSMSFSRPRVDHPSKQQANTSSSFEGWTSPPGVPEPKAC